MSKPLQTFKLLRGIHDESIIEVKDKDGNIISPAVKKTYKRGDVFQSSWDLLSLNGGGGAGRKFELVAGVPTAPQTGSSPSPQEGTPVVDHRATLEGMNLEELRAFAEAEEIPLQGVKTKAAIIDTILAFGQ